MTSIPVWNLTPWTTFGNWFSPFKRRQVLAAALTSLNTMSLAVVADKAPLWRALPKDLPPRSTVHDFVLISLPGFAGSCHFASVQARPIHSVDQCGELG